VLKSCAQVSRRERALLPLLMTIGRDARLPSLTRRSRNGGHTMIDPEVAKIVAKLQKLKALGRARERAPLRVV
jgi:hypothetical protein